MLGRLLGVYDLVQKGLKCAFVFLVHFFDCECFSLHVLLSFGAVDGVVDCVDEECELVFGELDVAVCHW